MNETDFYAIMEYAFDALESYYPLNEQATAIVDEFWSTVYA